MNLKLSLTLFITAICSCTFSPDHRPYEVADSFLTAYFQVDFITLLSLCLSNSELKKDMEQNARAFGEANSNLQEERINILVNYHYSIQEVRINQAKDSAFVTYLVFTPEIPLGNESHLTLVIENNDWKVAKLL